MPIERNGDSRPGIGEGEGGADPKAKRPPPNYSDQPTDDPNAGPIELTKVEVAERALLKLQHVIDDLIKFGIIESHQVGHIFERVMPPIREAAGR